ncbi:ribonuclease HI family protein [Patescibacteria group bacterium]|nr:ribonuclease HI family protein [Patescibacteria group bacterium]
MLREISKREVKLTIYCDGGARGNPGPGGIGVAIYQKGKLVKSVSKFVGSNITNNQAEYLAVIESLKQAQKLGASEVSLRVDSQLIERQLKGEYKVKNAGLKELYGEAKRLTGQFAKFAIEYLPREENKEADKLVNEALDRV